MSHRTQSDSFHFDEENSLDIHFGDESDNIEESQSKAVCVVSKHSVPISASLLIESLIKKICTIYEPDPKKSSRMYKVMCDKLYKMNLLGESYTMNEFEGIRSQYEGAFLRALASLKNGDTSLPLSPIWPKAEIHSHYHLEFDEMEYIAGGGFGQVFRVKHKLDGTEYAIKKIPIKSEGIRSVRNYLSEVKTFASMNHPNIVQYKGAWLQMGAPNAKNSSIENHSESQETSSYSYTKTHKTQYIYRKDSYSFTEEEEDQSDFQIDFEHSVSGAGSIAQVTPKLKKRRKSLSEGEATNALCKLDIKEIEKMRSVNRSKVKWATLYIQMALCHSTLRQWLETRNAVSNPEKALVHVNEQVIRGNTINEILKQLVKGLEYIHSKGVVHHDIKPSNIFIQLENDTILIQLGDFGLACPLQSAHHSLALGTKLYAAPEQLAGECNAKSDIYSLGIVLFELAEDFGTDMERVRHITELRNGHIPLNLSAKYPDIAQIISELVIKDPEKRPDTMTLLSTLNATEIQQVEQMKMQLAEKDVEIKHLKELLKSHGIKTL